MHGESANRIIHTRIVESTLYSKTCLIRNSRGGKKKKTFWIVKNLCNSVFLNNEQLVGKVSIAPVGTICSHLSCHHCHKSPFHME
jgi:hypothetical protein